MFSVVAIVLSAADQQISTACAAKPTEAIQLGQRWAARSAKAGWARCSARTTRCCADRRSELPCRSGSIPIRSRASSARCSTSQLTHPNTVAVFDYGHSPSAGQFLLRDGVPRRHRSPIGSREAPTAHSRCRASRLARRSAALQGGTRHVGIIHRDISRRSIILCGAAAFPTSRRSPTSAWSGEIQRNDGESKQMILGTPHYVARPGGD